MQDFKGIVKATGLMRAGGRKGNAVTEHEWLTTSEVGDMESLLFDTHQFSKRKMRRVSLEACRHVAHLLPPTCYLPIIEWAEHYSDGLTDQRSFLTFSRHLPRDSWERYPAATHAAVGAVGA